MLTLRQWVSRPAGRTSHYGNKDEFPKSGGSICYNKEQSAFFYLNVILYMNYYNALICNY